MYGAKTTPHMFVIDKEGKLVYQGRSTARPRLTPPISRTLENYVKVALEESMAGKPVSNASKKPYGCSVKYKQ